MQNLPTAETYEQEAKYMPWGDLLKKVVYLAKEIRQGGTVLDLLCGTGYLLGKLRAARPDFHLTGVDLSPEYLEYAKRTHPGIAFQRGDVRHWQSREVFDLVIVTGGLHHLPYEDQGPFIATLPRLLKEGGRAIVADPYIRDYKDEQGRKLAAAGLGYSYLDTTIRNGAPDDVVRAAAQLIVNDVCLVEYKTSIAKIEPVFKRHFQHVEKIKTWPRGDGGEDGDYCFVLENPRA